jgi:hypothetical protein
MQKVGGYSSQTFISQGVDTLQAAGGSTGINTDPLVNGVAVRFVKHASQAGGTTPIAWLTYSGSLPNSTNGYPIYDGDSLEVYDAEVNLAKVASSDANQPTVHYVLWRLR